MCGTRPPRPPRYQKAGYGYRKPWYRPGSSWAVDSRACILSPCGVNCRLSISVSAVGVVRSTVHGCTSGSSSYAEPNMPTLCFDVTALTGRCQLTRQMCDTYLEASVAAACSSDLSARYASLILSWLHTETNRTL